MTEEDRDQADAAMIALLNDQDGMPTTVTLRDGRELTVWNIAWGYDIGDNYAHITTNCSPFVGDLPLDFFCTDEVVEIRAFESRAVLLVRSNDARSIRISTSAACEDVGAAPHRAAL